MTDEHAPLKPEDDWHLQSIKIEFRNWGEDKGKYIGMIKFQNGEQESFAFQLKPELARVYINLIASNIVKSASELGSRLIKSLGLRDDEIGKG